MRTALAETMFAMRRRWAEKELHSSPTRIRLRPKRFWPVKWGRPNVLSQSVYSDSPWERWFPTGTTGLLQNQQRRVPDSSATEWGIPKTAGCKSVAALCGACNGRVHMPLKLNTGKLRNSAG